MSGPPDPDLARLRDLIYEVAGIFHPDNKLGLLRERTGRRMKDLQISGLSDYLALLTSPTNSRQELVALLNEITIGETCFFRNRNQLDAFRRIVLPNLLSAKLQSPHRGLRVWSAGCSTGEEPYSIRMLMLEEADTLLKSWDVEILATDINEHALSRAHDAIYDRHSTRYLPPDYRQRYFAELDKNFEVLPPARSNVAFSRLNLSDGHEMSSVQGVDAIFCCNVLIYFDLVSKRRVLRQFFENLLPHGYLFLGCSESLHEVSDDFTLVHLPGATAYLKRKPELEGHS